ncbi:MAG: lytic transglycosylase domain-containing protein, partial [Candidatus Omnitrophica bacterium]|nr:lytic transglycosylase domain-containing protein [Candidatus Omnitrophota bacterium]
IENEIGQLEKILEVAAPRGPPPGLIARFKAISLSYPKAIAKTVYLISLGGPVNLIRAYLASRANTEIPEDIKFDLGIAGRFLLSVFSLWTVSAEIHAFTVLSDWVGGPVHIWTQALEGPHGILSLGHDIVGAVETQAGKAGVVSDFVYGMAGGEGTLQEFQLKVQEKEQSRQFGAVINEYRSVLTGNGISEELVEQVMSEEVVEWKEVSDADKVAFMNASGLAAASKPAPKEVTPEILAIVAADLSRQAEEAARAAEAAAKPGLAKKSEETDDPTTPDVVKKADKADDKDDDKIGADDTAILLSGRTDVQEYVKAEVVKHAAFDETTLPFDLTQEDINNLIFTIMHIENRGRSTGTSEAGAKGIMQIMEGTWNDTVQRLTDNGIIDSEIDYAANVNDPQQSIMVGVAHIARLVETMAGRFESNDVTQDEFIKIVAASYFAGENHKSDQWYRNVVQMYTKV